MNNQELRQVFYDLYNAIQKGDAETERHLRLQLASQSWSSEQIEFYLEERAADFAKASRQREFASRRNAVIVSFLVAIPTLLASIAFQKLALANDYFLIAQLERWYGGIVVGSLSSLAVNDYRLWLEADLRRKNLSEQNSAKVLEVWARQSWRQRLSIFLRPRLLAVKTSDLAVNSEEIMALWQRSSASRQLQGFLLLRFSERGWNDFWRAVKVEKNLGPSRFFLILSLLCSLPVAFESLSAGISAAIASYVLVEVMVPIVSVSNIYFPSLLSGISTSQSSNVVAAVRVLVVTFFMAVVVLLELYLRHLGLPRVRLLDLF